MIEWIKSNWILCLFFAFVIFCFTILAIELNKEATEKREVAASIERRLVLLESEDALYTRVIEECTRINLLSCIACHDFPAFIIDVQPEIWEEPNE